MSLDNIQKTQQKDEVIHFNPSELPKHEKLGELASTAISGNDISSSVLYVSALAIVYAGQYAWITLLIVALVLFFFRKIYGEVVGALPLNGGAYNALLNTTSKRMSSLAATLTLLSYMATAVISAKEGIHYFFHLLGIKDMNMIVLGTTALLAIFAGLAIMGIKESSKVAIAIFIFHLTTMVILVGAVLLLILNHGFGTFVDNWHQPPRNGSIIMALFFGFSASMLGISGFESSANFVEEQKPGVFPKTLRNMWIVVGILNPLMAFLALSALHMNEVDKDTLLIQLGNNAAGDWLGWIVSVDAFLVLSGAVLTSYVGVTGLLERMTLDRIMPNFFLKKNSRGASYRIILLFFILSVSVLAITWGDVEKLAGVYTLSFLSVMLLFVIGNILLKVKRKHLPRPEVAPWFGILLAFSAVIIAIVGNMIIKDPAEPEVNKGLENLKIFFTYFIPTLAFVMVMLNRTVLLKLLLNIVQYIFEPIRKFFLQLHKGIDHLIDEINSQEFVFFTKGKSIANMNKAMLYIRDNEHTKKVKIVKVLKPGEKPSEELIRNIKILDEEYPEIDIEFVPVEGEFGPELIKELSTKWNIPINFMFIGSPDEKFPYRLEELGGVRLIM